MKPKKSPEANLENKRGLFLQVGLILALAFCLVILNQGQKERKALSNYAVAVSPDTHELPPVTNFPEPPKPLLKMVPAPDLINVVKNDAKISTELPDFVFPEGGYYVPQPVEDEKPVDEPWVLSAEIMPRFMGGDGDLAAFRNWVHEKIKYPLVALENRIQGKVTLSFIVDKNGKVTHIEVLQAPDNSLAEEAVRVVRNSPEWSPGLQGGIPVRIKFNLPLEFKIQ